MTRKHYYDENGVLNYTYNDDWVNNLYLAIKHHTDTVKQRSLVSEVASKMIYNVITYTTLSASKLEAYFKEETGCKIEASLKPALQDFVQQGYIAQEFILVANAMVANMQFDIAVS